MTRATRRIRTLVLALLAACAVAACKYAAPKSPALNVFACKVSALEPYVGDVYDTEALVRDILSGKADAVRTLTGLGVIGPRFVAASEAYFACDPPEVVPTGVVL